MSPTQRWDLGPVHMGRSYLSYRKHFGKFTNEISPCYEIIWKVAFVHMRVMRRKIFPGTEISLAAGEISVTETIFVSYEHNRSRLAGKLSVYTLQNYVTNKIIWLAEMFSRQPRSLLISYHRNVYPTITNIFFENFDWNVFKTNVHVEKISRIESTVRRNLSCSMVSDCRAHVTW